jgi:sRNA-binding carbon storage regulator CsrA
MIQVRLVPAPVEPVVLVKVVQLLRRAVRPELVAPESVALQREEHLASVAQVVQQSRLVQVAQAAASDLNLKNN